MIYTELNINGVDYLLYEGADFDCINTKHNLWKYFTGKGLNINIGSIVCIRHSECVLKSHYDDTVLKLYDNNNTNLNKLGKTRYNIYLCKRK